MFSVGMCQEFCPQGGGSADTPLPRADTHPLGRHPLPLGQTPPPEMATAADCVHPPGMHSCFTKQMNRNQFLNYLCLYWTEKRLSDDRRERRNQIKKKQKFANYNKWYGETLEGNLYKAETIIVENSNKKSNKISVMRGNDTKDSGKSKGKKVNNPY